MVYTPEPLAGVALRPLTIDSGVVGQFADGNSLLLGYTSGGIVYVNSGGSLAGSANMTFNATTGVPTFAAGLNAGFSTYSGGLEEVVGFRLARHANITFGWMLDYQDMLYYAGSRGTVSLAPAPGSGAAAYLFTDAVSYVTYASGSSPGTIVMEAVLTSPIPHGDNQTGWAIGITFRSDSAAANPTNIKIELDSAGSYYTVYNANPGTVASTGQWVSPSFTTLTPYTITKVKITVTNTNPLPAAFRMQRVILYHGAGTWDNFHLHVGGGTMYGDVTLNTSCSLRNVGTLVCAPGGTGAFQLSSTGNTRGNYAVDLQIDRANVAQVASGANSVILGGQNNTNACNDSVICGGDNNSIPASCGVYNTIVGGYSNVTVAATTDNGVNFIGGGEANRIQGKYCVITGGYDNTILLAAGATNSFIGCGYSHRITASNSVIIGGFNSIISGAGSTIVGGVYHTISSANGVILGGYGNNVSADYGVASGFRTVANKYGQFAQASGKIATSGDAQSSILISRKQTTDATPAELFTNGSSTRITILEATTWLFNVKVIARQTNDDFSVAAYHVEGIISRDTGGNAAIINQASIYTNEEDTDWDFAVSADTGNQSLKLLATGKAANTINWVARIELVEVTG